MKQETTCENCRHGYTVKGTTRIVTRNMTTLIQNPGGGGSSTTCMKQAIKQITITDAGMICSDFEPREAELDAEAKQGT